LIIKNFNALKQLLDRQKAPCIQTTLCFDDVLNSVLEAEELMMTEKNDSIKTHKPKIALSINHKLNNIRINVGVLIAAVGG
jgi:hypothetical protein